MWVAFANVSNFFQMQTLLIFFTAKTAYVIFNDQSFNHMLTNDIVSYEQLGPDL